MPDSFLRFPGHNEQIVYVKVHTAKYHKYRKYDLYRHRIAADARIENAEPAGPHCRKRKYDRIVQTHAGDQQTDDLQGGNGNINAIEELRRSLYFRHEFPHRRARTFRTHQMHIITARKRQYRNDQHKHAHAADPVRKKSPELYALRQIFHIRQNAAAGGRQSRYRFKKRIGKIRNLSA